MTDIYRSVPDRILEWKAVGEDARFDRATLFDYMNGGATGSDFIAAAADLTTDLSDDHPVSVYWSHQTGGAGSGPYCNNCHAAHNPTLQLSVLPFFNHYVECSTCHNVHNSSGNAHLLRLPLAGSALCLYCHRK